MPEKVLTHDLDNCLINFDRKVVVTNLLDEYGGLLEEIAKTVNEFLTTEEAKGRKFLKTFLLLGLEGGSENEVITVVPEEKLKQQEEQLRGARSMLYSAESEGGSKAPPYEFVPLKWASIKLDSLVVQEAVTRVPNGTAIELKEEKQPPPKKTGALGTMFKKQEATAAAKKNQEEVPSKEESPEKKPGALGVMFKKQEAKRSPQAASPKELSPENKPGALGALFKKQETTAAAKKSPDGVPPREVSPEKKPGAKKKEAPAKKSTKPEPEKKGSGTLGAMFKKQESTATKKSPETEKSKPASSKATKSFFAKKEDTKPSVIKPPTPKKVNEFFKKEVKNEPATSANVSVNLFEEDASSSDDEETLDALKRDILTDDDDDKPSTSNKRRRIIDSDDDDTGPEVKIERKEEVVEIEDDQPKASETFMDEDGFIVTVKAKRKGASSKPSPTPAKVKKESPKSPAKKEAASKPPAAKTKQGNIMSFFTKK